MTLRTRVLISLVFLTVACEEDGDPVAPTANNSGGGGGQSYEIKFEAGGASGWFGGDDRSAFGPRDIGVGCSVLIDDDIVLESFSFAFETRFDYSENPDGTGHDVTLPLNVRNEAGAVLKTVQLNLPASYAGGWATWTGIDLNVDAGTTLVFTTFLVGAYDTNEYTNYHSADAAAGYANGARYTKQGASDAEMEQWAGWNEHPWDAKFWVQGETR